jgi:hypothetical protein
MNWKGEREVVFGYFKVLSRYLPGGTEKTHENLRIADLRAET